MRKIILSMSALMLTLLTLIVGVFAWFHINNGGVIKDFKGNTERLFDSQTIYEFTDITTGNQGTTINYNNPNYEKASSMVEVSLDSSKQNYIRNLRVSILLDIYKPSYLKFKVILEKRINGDITVSHEMSDIFSYPNLVPETYGNNESTGFYVLNEILTTGIRQNYLLAEIKSDANLASHEANIKYYVSVVSEAVQANRKNNVWNTEIPSINLSANIKGDMNVKIKYDNTGLQELNKNYLLLHSSENIIEYIHSDSKKIRIDENKSYRMIVALPTYFKVSTVTFDNNLLTITIAKNNQTVDNWGFEHLIVTPAAEVPIWKHGDNYKINDVVMHRENEQNPYDYYRAIAVNVGNMYNNKPSLDYQSVWIKLERTYTKNFVYSKGDILYYSNRIWMAVEDNVSNNPPGGGSQQWISLDNIYTDNSNYPKWHSWFIEKQKVENKEYLKKRPIVMYYEGSNSDVSGWYYNSRHDTGTNIPTQGNGPTGLDRQWAKVGLDFQSNVSYKTNDVVTQKVGGIVRYYRIKSDYSNYNLGNYEELLLSEWQSGTYSAHQLVSYSSSNSGVKKIFFSKVTTSKVPGTLNNDGTSDWREITSDYSAINEYRINQIIMYKGLPYIATKDMKGSSIGKEPTTNSSYGYWKQINQKSEYYEMNQYYNGEAVLYNGYYWILKNEDAYRESQNNHFYGMGVIIHPGTDKNIWARQHIKWSPNDDWIS